jgi:hypothetical protein
MTTESIEYLSLLRLTCDKRAESSVRACGILLISWDKYACFRCVYGDAAMALAVGYLAVTFSYCRYKSHVVAAYDCGVFAAMGISHVLITIKD